MVAALPKPRRNPHKMVLFGARKKTGPHKLTAQPPHCTGSTPCVPDGSSISPEGTRLPCCGCARWGVLHPHLKAPILVRLSTTHQLACTKIAAGPWRPPTDPPGLDCSRCGSAAVPGLVPGTTPPQNAKAHWTPQSVRACMWASFCPGCSFSITASVLVCAATNLANSALIQVSSAFALSTSVLAAMYQLQICGLDVSGGINKRALPVAWPVESAAPAGRWCSLLPMSLPLH